jgi:urea transport system substrate-binding protein
VCEADDPALGRRVAIKLIPHEPDSRPGRGRARREWALARRVRHPHVVAVWDSGAYDGGSYLVMELVDGPSVHALVRGGPLDWRGATAVLIAAAEAASAVHARGIVHRDIKPANLLRAADGAVKLADFGLARRLVTPGARHAPARPAGTPHFMSPEQCRADACDERSDVYSLGATYYALLTGSPPYPGGTPLQVMFAHCAAPVPDPAHAGRPVPRACAEVVARAMAKARAERFGSARDMQAALRATLDDGAPARR